MPKLILIADDDANARDALKMLVDIWGHAVIIAKNGLEAVEQSLSRRPDIVLMDLEMPEMDGIEATRQIRRQMARIEKLPIVIALTGCDGAAHRKATAAAGCAEHLVKPISMEELRTVLERH